MVAMRMRWACAAGTFYPGNPMRLRVEVERCLGGSREELGPSGPGLTGPVGLILPHAGYRYSGPVAGMGYRALWQLGRPEAAIILGTNHTGLGGAVSVAEPGAWETPWGAMPVAEGLSRQLAEALDAELTNEPFLDEHSVEVQLPFLQYLYGEIPFVGAVVQRLSLEEAEAMGEAMAQVISDRALAVIVSTDFTHYEPHEAAWEKDHQALRHILNLDTPGFLETVRKQRITICGVGAVALFLAAARRLRLFGTQLLLYRTSGEVAGPMDQVVGYAAVLFRKVDEVA